MFLSRTKKNAKKPSEDVPKLYLKTETLPTMRDFSRGKRNVLHVYTKSNDNESSTK